ncbi:hypothetical protein V5E97_09520 [Singulisphaera sp. Ch08]|uniref:SPW repeat-containing protein n=1 Tax=Singulisphaera sp. Ch08 TaxID=3120278 RepID=A0AAU7CMD6_9BACT
MRLPRLRYKLRQLMGWVVIVAIASVLASEIWEPFPPRNKQVDFLVGAAVSVAVGVGAVRHPLTFLAIALVLWGGAPVIDHGFNAVTLSAQGGALAWMIGSSWGWLSRGLRDARIPLPPE